MSENDRKKRFCPIDKDFVVVGDECTFCEFWDGLNCTTGDHTRISRRAAKLALKRFGKSPRRLMRPRRGGKGFKIPPVCKEWPIGKTEDDGLPLPDGEAVYGIPGAFMNDDLDIQIEPDDYILPELIKEYWDVEPDAPDWDIASAPPVVTEPKPIIDPFGDPLPPAIGPGPGSDIMPNAMPDIPPDLQEPGLP